MSNSLGHEWGSWMFHGCRFICNRHTVRSKYADHGVKWIPRLINLPQKLHIRLILFNFCSNYAYEIYTKKENILNRNEELKLYNVSTYCQTSCPTIVFYIASFALPVSRHFSLHERLCLLKNYQNFPLRSIKPTQTRHCPEKCLGRL